MPLLEAAVAVYPKLEESPKDDLLAYDEAQAALPVDNTHAVLNQLEIVVSPESMLIEREWTWCCACRPMRALHHRVFLCRDVLFSGRHSGSVQARRRPLFPPRRAAVQRHFDPLLRRAVSHVLLRELGACRAHTCLSWSLQRFGSTPFCSFSRRHCAGTRRWTYRTTSRCCPSPQ